MTATSYTALRARRDCVRQQWAALAAALVLTLCSPQHGTANTIPVTTTDQGITDDQRCSLQEAIYASEFQDSTAIRSTNPDTAYTTGCAKGSGDDTIVLPAGAVFKFDHFWDQDAFNGFGPTATPIILSKITIVGNGATLLWDDSSRPVPGNSRLFAIGKGSGPFTISGTGDLTLQNVYIKGFRVKGGNGGVGGGGGGLGAGGAIFNYAGYLTVENSTFENNGAVGGNGDGHTGPTSSTDLSGGGGGGLSGNGGFGCVIAGGGGGGSRGNGGSGGCGSTTEPVGRGGGGGGGTILSGGDGQTGGSGVGGSGGFRCGGNGGNKGNDGDSVTNCPGGGGGGAGWDTCLFCGDFPDGGMGGYGGGGGGGVGSGGHGGFGGGGGAGNVGYFVAHGGDGGIGGGGGATPCTSLCISYPGKGGVPFGGNADDHHGGGGGALGGAIFSDVGYLTVRNSTFFNNFVTRGEGGGGSADKGADAGGAIFSLDSLTEINQCTFTANQSTGSGGAVVVYSVGGGAAPVALTLWNNIIANNGPEECYVTPQSMPTDARNNLIMNNGSGTGHRSPCPKAVVFSDPQLQPLQWNSPGNTPTMAIPNNSSAIDAADPDLSKSPSTDQRGVDRPQPRGGRFDIGAFEARSEDQTTTWNPSDKATSVTLADGNLTFVSGWIAYNGIRAVASASSGNKYWELKARQISSAPSAIFEGIANASLPTNGPTFLGGDFNGIGWAGDGKVWINNAVVATI